VQKACDGDGTVHRRQIFAYDGNQIVMNFWRANSGDLQIGHLRERYLWGPAMEINPHSFRSPSPGSLALVTLSPRERPNHTVPSVTRNCSYHFG